ncbi:MAG TPA: pentapeptide repeat-containing protein [Candidatus Helicobacter avistercoris]|nr:pentapeptide repeat-containing protein [Candidatus Helicobacter avistercoris]
MFRIETRELQEIKKLNDLYLKKMKLDDCYQRFLELQDIRKRYNHSSSWQHTSQYFEIDKESEKLLVDLDLQEEDFIQIFREDILKKLGIQNSKDDSIQWKGSEYFEIKDIKNINNTNLNFFPTIKKYKIRFENCSFVGDKISQGDNQSCFFYQLNYPEPEIDFPLTFNNCIFFNFVNLPSIVFHKQIFFNHCIFFNGVNFHGSTFKEDIFLQDAVYRKKSDFSHCIFEKRAFFGGTRTKFKCEAIFLDATFKEESNFSKVIFESEANFFLTHSIEQDTKGFRKHANFSGACFKKNANFDRNIFFAGDFRKTTFKDNANFSESLFLKFADFSDTKFLGKTIFKDAKMGEISKEQNVKPATKFSRCTFSREVDFSSTHFYNETYFHRAIFHQDIQFYRSYFEGIANFYFVDFKGIPNFSMCVFNQPKFVNFVGVVLPQNTIDKLEEYINQKAGQEAKEKDNAEKGRTKSYLCIQHSLNIRDSFRVIKETLIAQGNLLDTQQWHKLELYAKELEYQYRNDISTLSQEVEDLKKQEKIKDCNEIDSVRILEINKNELEKNKIDRWQLWFYRQISDHHTNLAQIIANLVLLISLFGIYTLALFSLNKTTEMLKIDFENIAIFTPLQTITFVFSKNPTQVPWEWQIFSYFVVFFSGIYSYCILRKHVGRLAFGTSAIDALVFIFFIYCYRFDFYEAILIAFLCLSFVGMYVVLLWKKHILISLSSFVFCFIVLIYKPSLLLPFVGQLFDEGLKANFPAMQSLSVVYCILMFLMLFSLQKTARKNSIIPS